MSQSAGASSTQAAPDRLGLESSQGGLHREPMGTREGRELAVSGRQSARAVLLDLCLEIPNSF